jgi:hypothetical protein
MGHAEREKSRPLYGYSDETGASQAHRKAHRRAVTTAGAAIGIYGRRAAVRHEARDGAGGVAVVERMGGGERIEPPAPPRWRTRVHGGDECGGETKLPNGGRRRIRTSMELAGV